MQTNVDEKPLFLEKPLKWDKTDFSFNINNAGVDLQNCVSTIDVRENEEIVDEVVITQHTPEHHEVTGVSDSSPEVSVVYNEEGDRNDLDSNSSLQESGDLLS